MNHISQQEKHIVSTLTPLFEERGYELLPCGKQWRLPTKNGFRAALVSISGTEGAQTIELNLGIRLDVVEELANQFIADIANSCSDSMTVLASYSKLVQQPAKRFFLNNDTGIVPVCSRIESFMRSKGFSFLEHFDRLRKVDGLLNRKPNIPCPLLLNPLQRCFKGLVLAKLTHRTDFDRLVKAYTNNLNKAWTEPGLLANYLKMVQFLRFYSIN